MFSLIFWGVWAVFVGVVMAVDRSLRKTEDFTPAPTGYFVLAAISPFLVLPIYFYAARRNGSTGDRVVGMVAGCGLTMVCFLLAAVHTVAWELVLRRA